MHHRSVSFLPLSIALLVAACAAPDLTVDPVPDPGTPGGTIVDRAPGSASGSSAPTPTMLVLIRGQSNAHGVGLPAQLPLGAADPLAQPFPAVDFTAIYGNNGEPETRRIYPIGPLSPTCGAGSGEIGAGSGSALELPLVAGSGAGCTFGIEITLGRALAAARPDIHWIIAKDTADSTAIGGQWWPWGVYEPNGPTSDPWGDNLFMLSEQREAALLQATGATLAAEIWIQGEDDALGYLMGQVYGSHLAGWKGEDDFYWRTQISSAAPAPFIYGRVSTSMMWGSGTPLGLAGVRAGEDAFAVTPGVIEVDQDAAPLGTDHAHFATDGYLELGSAYAAAVLGTLGR